MSRKPEPVSAIGYMVLILVLFTGAVIKAAYLSDPDYYWALLFLLPLLSIAIYHSRQKRL
jgi:prepilin signal peptidase PulO-like enzyme (type II secretory pathway)